MRLLLGLIALFIIPGSVLALWDALIVIAGNPDIWIPMFCGFALGIPFYFIVIRKIHVISTFEHELTHALVALFFLRRIHKFIVTSKRGGQVQYSGNFGGEFGNLLIGLAPYYLPTLTLIAVIVRPFLPTGWFPWYDGFIGATLAFHIFSTIDETRLSWTKHSFTGAGDHQKTKSDIGKVGYIFAFLVISGFGIFLLGLSLQLIGSGYSGTWHFLKQVAMNSYSDYYSIIREIYKFLASFIR
jgi:Peptidase M50B-like